MWLVTAPPASAQDTTDRLIDLLGPADPAPLTAQQRFQTYLLNAAGPVPIIGEGLGAAFSQRIDSPPEWGRGWHAYGMRFGSDLAFNAVRQTISYTAGAVFHEDYRYFASRDQAAWRRARHALISTFAARRPDGSQSFSISSVTSVVGASGISSLWGPPSWQGAGGLCFSCALPFQFRQVLPKPG